MGYHVTEQAPRVSVQLHDIISSTSVRPTSVILVTKTKTKTKMIHIYITKTKTRIIGCQKNENEIKIKMIDQKTK